MINGSQPLWQEYASVLSAWTRPFGFVDTNPGRGSWSANDADILVHGHAGDVKNSGDALLSEADMSDS